MKRSGFGYAVLSGPLGTDERDTFTCGHACSAIFHIQPGQRPEDAGGMCKVCMRLICRNCVGKGCLPIEKWLEAEEDPRAHRRLYGI